MLKTPIKLPIYHHTDVSDTLQELGIKPSSHQSYDVKDVIFYNINAISEYHEDDVNGSAVHANGSEYICSLTIKQLQEEIAKYNV